MQTATATRPAVSLLAIAGNVQIDSLTISPDVMRHHYIANAKIDDMEPSQVVAAIIAVEDAIRATYPQMRRTGWGGRSDGLRIYFYAWTLAGRWAMKSAAARAPFHLLKFPAPARPAPVSPEMAQVLEDLRYLSMLPNPRRFLYIARFISTFVAMTRGER